MHDGPEAAGASASVTIVGIGPAGWSALGQQARDAIERAPLVIAGHRQQTLLPDIAGQDRRRWPTPLLPSVEALLGEYHGRHILLVVSADSLTTIGTTILDRLGPTRVLMLPIGKRECGYGDPMATDAAIAEIRAALGPVGAFVGISGSSPAVDGQREGIQRLERAGYPAVWTNELIGADALVRASLWLAATEHVVVGTCIANMWARPAQTAHAAATQLSQAYPGRFVLGLGIGYPDQAAGVGRDFGSPLATAREYLQRVSDPPYRRILAANGPRMLSLAGELSDGALPAGTSAAVTAQARARVGADKLLVVYVGIQAAGPTAAISDLLGRHLDAGADHVILGMSFNADFSVAIDRLAQLAQLAPRRGGR